MATLSNGNKKLIVDTIIFIFCILLAWWLVSTALLLNFLKVILPAKFLVAFLSGIFFTSFLTTPVAIASFLVLADHIDPLLLIFIGSIGAALGDLLIIKLFRDSVFQDFTTLSKDLKLKKFFHYFRHLHFSHLAPLLGAMIIASPFPDEAGLALIGVSKLNYKQLALLTYFLNALGISILVYFGSII